MQAFFKNRLAYHQKKIMKYMKYVFNDHFVIVCTFLMGGAGFYYSQIVKTLDKSFVWGYPIILLVWLFALRCGRLATLTEPADQVFLLPKELQMGDYLKRAIRYSLLLPLFICFIAAGLIMPLYAVVSQRGAISFIYFFIMLFLLKIGDIYVQAIQLFQETAILQRKLRRDWWVGTILAIIFGLYLFPLFGVLMALGTMAASFFVYRKVAQENNLDWEKMIKFEQDRMHRIYQFIHLFTDVPEITSSVKRRKYFDRLLARIPMDHGHTYLYLYSRSFLRGSEYSGIFFRLVLVAGLLLLFVPQFWLALLIAVLFVYLIGFQMLPLYTQFDYMLLTNLYPIKAEKKQQALAQLLTYLLIIAGCIFSIAAIIGIGDIRQSIFIILAVVVESVLFLKVYVPYRLRKLA